MGVSKGLISLMTMMPDEEISGHDTVALAYDRYRPPYPPALVEHIVNHTHLPTGASLFEIGSGTGLATEPFAVRGDYVLCLEPGANLAAVARKKLARYPNVSIEQVHLEDWKVKTATFDLAFSASAFHWIRPEVGYPKTFQALKPRGWLALFWHMFMEGEGEVNDQIQMAYQQLAPELCSARLPWEDRLRMRGEAILASGYFTALEVTRYPFSLNLSAEVYAGLLGTFSDHLRLPRARLKQLLLKVREIIDHNGGWLEKKVISVLYLARKKEISSASIIPRTRSTG